MSSLNRIVHALIAAWVYAIAWIGFAGASECRPEVLEAVKRVAQTTRAAGQVPVVVMDLDDTLINTRQRNLRTLRDFSGQD